MTDLCYRSARELADLVRTKQVSAVELLTAHLDRIDLVNPQVNAIVSLDPELALADARAADDTLLRGEPCGPLHGLPMAFKDTHAAAGLPNTFGSALRADNWPERDELIVSRLRSAGVVRLGKTNVPEFAAGSHTFNKLFGTTLNPYDPSRSAGGSSGGAAASLACGMQPLADGNDMGGSLRNPAAFCNVVGLRPTPGRVPTYPAELAWQTLSVQGPMARNVADLALMLSVIAGPTALTPLAISEDPAGFARPLPTELTGLRVAWSPDLNGQLQVADDVLDTLTPAMKIFDQLGAHVDAAAPDFSGAEEVFRTIRAWQFQALLGPLLAEHPDGLKQSLADNIRAGADLSAADVATAWRLQTTLFDRITAFFGSYDVLALPVTQVTPFPADQEYPADINGVVQETYLDWMRSCFYISAVGLPAISVPAGFTADGLPVGLQLVAPGRGERRLLEIAHAFETARGGDFVRPTLTP